MTSRVIAAIAVLSVLVSLVTATAWFLLRGRGRAQAAETAKPAAIGRELRRLALTTPPDKMGFGADGDYPSVYGVLVDWNIDDETASVLSMAR